MAAFAVGDVVLVRFPFSDLTAAKLRPALILADAQLVSGIAGSLSATTHSHIVETIEQLLRRDMPR